MSLNLSFEFFPPKTEELENKLWENILALEAFRPKFVSVTYGAGGSTRERTHSILKRIVDKTTLKPASHLTCVNATRAEIDAIAKDYWENGIKHIVALRGDMPGMAGKYVPHPDGYAYGADIVRGLKKVADFEISVAAYPETHPDALSPESDIKYLKEKIDAGATRAITQFFFEAETYFKFLEKCQKAGITVPIVPGILTIGNFNQAVKFAGMCNTDVPQWLHKKYEESPENHEASVEVATKLCQDLIKGGVKDLHFYTLNRADLTTAVLKNLG